MRIVNSRKADPGAAAPPKKTVKTVRLGSLPPRVLPPTPAPLVAPVPAAAPSVAAETQDDDGAAERLFERFSGVLDSAQQLIDTMAAHAGRQQEPQEQGPRQRFLTLEVTARDENNRIKTISAVETTLDPGTEDHPSEPA